MYGAWGKVRRRHFFQILCQSVFRLFYFWQSRRTSYAKLAFNLKLLVVYRRFWFFFHSWNFYWRQSATNLSLCKHIQCDHFVSLETLTRTHTCTIKCRKSNSPYKWLLRCVPKLKTFDVIWCFWYSFFPSLWIFLPFFRTDEAELGTIHNHSKRMRLIGSRAQSTGS